MMCNSTSTMPVIDAIVVSAGICSVQKRKKVYSTWLENYFIRFVKFIFNLIFIMSLFLLVLYFLHSISFLSSAINAVFCIKDCHSD